MNNQELILRNLQPREQYRQYIANKFLVPHYDSPPAKRSYYSKLPTGKILIFKEDDLGYQKTVLSYSYIPKGIKTDILVREMKTVYGYSESAFQATFGFGNDLLPDIIFSVCLFVILCPNHRLAKIISKYSLQGTLKTALNLKITERTNFICNQVVNYVQVTPAEAKIIQKYAEIHQIINKLKNNKRNVLEKARKLQDMMINNPHQSNFFNRFWGKHKVQEYVELFKNTPIKNETSQSIMEIESQSEQENRTQQIQ